MNKRIFVRATVLAALALAGGAALAQDNVFKIGLVLPMTGQQATTGRQRLAAGGDGCRGHADPALVRCAWHRTRRGRVLYGGGRRGVHGRVG